MSLVILQGGVVVNRALDPVYRDVNTPVYPDNLKSEAEYIPNEGELVFDNINPVSSNPSMLATLNIDGLSVAVFNGVFSKEVLDNHKVYDDWKCTGATYAKPGTNFVQNMQVGRTAFPVIRQGTVSIKNTGSNTIKNRSKVQWYFPSENEFNRMPGKRAVACVRSFDYAENMREIVTANVGKNLTEEEKQQKMLEAQSRIIGEAQAEALSGSMFGILLQ